MKTLLILFAFLIFVSCDSSKDVAYNEDIYVTYQSGERDTINLSLLIKEEWYIHFYVNSNRGSNCLEYLIRNPYSGTRGCGKINADLKLSDREWHCECGLTHDRDINAAINIKNLSAVDSKNQNELPELLGVMTSETDVQYPIQTKDN